MCQKGELTMKDHDDYHMAMPMIQLYQECGKHKGDTPTKQQNKHGKANVDRLQAEILLPIGVN